MLSAWKYNIDDKEILLAIANHSGRPDMSFLEKVIMLSDLYDFYNKKNINISYVLEADSVDKVLLKILGICLKLCVKKNIFLVERTRDAFDYILESFFKVNHPDNNISSDLEVLFKDSTQNIKSKNTALEERIFREAVKLNEEHSLKLKSIENIRDLCGFVNSDGKKIKKHKILRSATLSNLSKQDAKYLKDYGITTIIGLRAESEVKQSPDINVDGFKYYNCPLPVTNEGLESFRDRLFERKGQAFSTNEDMWYNVQYIASFNMIGMYKKYFLTNIP